MDGQTGGQTDSPTSKQIIQLRLTDMHAERDRQTDLQARRQTVRLTERKTNRQTDKPTDRQTNKHSDLQQTIRYTDR